MPHQALVRTRGELSEFLLHHRQKLTPLDAGLPAAGRRRTPGLRREEVSALAGVGLTWYTWFEQGRDIQVSEAFLLNVARALKLDDDACCQLFLLAQGRPAPLDAFAWSPVTPLIQQMLDDLVTRPAYVLNLRWDIVAFNAAADRLLGLRAREQADRNLMRMVFTDPALRLRLPDWAASARKLQAQFRWDLTSSPDDPALLALADELKQLSADFREWWAQSRKESYGRGIGSILDDTGARLDFRHETLTIDGSQSLWMVVHFSCAQQEGSFGTRT